MQPAPIAAPPTSSGATPEPKPISELPPQSEGFRLEQERRRKEMERLQHEAEEAERIRRAARMQEIMREQQDAVQKEAEQRRKLLEQLPAPPK